MASKRQAIKYQNTTVEPGKSATELAHLVQKYGGTRFEMQWAKDGLLTGIRFALRHPKFGEVPVRLTARTGRIDQLLERVIWNNERRREQAYRIAWRQLKDFVEQQLLAVETGLFPVHEVFMAQVETTDPATGDLITMGELLERHAVAGAGGVLRLSAGPPVVDARFEVE